MYGVVSERLPTPRRRWREDHQIQSALTQPRPLVRFAVIGWEGGGWPPKRAGELAKGNAGQPRQDRSGLHNHASWPAGAINHGISAIGSEALALGSTRLPSPERGQYERLWRSVKYEEAYLRAYVSDARTSIDRYESRLDPRVQFDAYHAKRI
jgi:hypothetical protein